MKSKKTIYILLPAVLALWGYIIYYVVSNFGGEPTISAHQQPHITIAELATAPQVEFELSLNYKDPFLKTMPRNRTPVSPTVSRLPSSPKPPPPKQSISWPAVRFNGAIRNEKSNRKVYAIGINSDDFLMAEGDEIREVTLKKVSQDSIYLEYKGEKKSFPR